MSIQSIIQESMGITPNSCVKSVENNLKPSTYVCMFMSMSSTNKTTLEHRSKGILMSCALDCCCRKII